MKILVFTNYESLRNVKVETVINQDDEGNETSNELGLLLQNNNFVFREDKEWKGSDSAVEVKSDFILIKDTISKIAFNQLIGTFTENETYFVIYHRQPEDEEFADLKKQSNWKPGQHEPNNPVYQSMADVIADANDKSDKIIVKEIDKHLNLSIDTNYQIKCNFLTHIKNGLKPGEFEYFNLINIDKTTLLYFENNPYKFELDYNIDFNTGKEQRDQLTKIKEAIFN